MYPRTRILMVLAGVTLFLGGLCTVPSPGLAGPGVEAAETSGTQEAPAQESRGIKDLTCFKCHIYERFLQEPAPGVFSHALHVQFDYHCNQCHSFRGHRRMVINTKICTFCHDSVPQLKKP